MNTCHIQHDYLVLDTCCVINIFATHHAASILQALPVKIATVVEVRQESKWYRSLSESGEKVKEPIDLQRFIALQVVQEIMAGDDEAEANLLTDLENSGLGEGEAASGAVAIARNWAIGIDDSKAIGIIRALKPDLQIVTTPELIKCWVEATQPADDLVRTILQRIELNRYKPPPEHRLYRWWDSFF